MSHPTADAQADIRSALLALGLTLAALLVGAVVVWLVWGGWTS